MIALRILFYVVVGLFIPILASIINSLVGGRRRAAWRALRVYLVLAAVYTTALVAVTLATPIEMLNVSSVQYSGDWSISVLSLRHLPHGVDEDYEIDFRMGNRGSEPVHGEKNLVPYLLTDDGTRYDAMPTPSDPPFDAEVKPNKFVVTTRRFVLPTNLNKVELVLARKGLRLGQFVIGRYPFDGHTAIVLQ